MIARHFIRPILFAGTFLVLTAGARAQSVVITNAASPTSIDLTTLGTADWVQPNGFSNNTVTFNRSATGLSQIGPFSYTVGYYGGTGTPTGPTSFTWENGTPTLVGSSSQGVSTGGAFGTGDGFSFTVPADTLTRTLTVYVGADNADGTLSASLSGGGGTFSSTFTGTGYNTIYRAFTVTYSALSTQTLNVQFATSGTKYGDYSGANSDIFGAALSAPLTAAPEPSATAAFAVGLLSLGGLRLAARRRHEETAAA